MAWPEKQNRYFANNERSEENEQKVQKVEQNENYL